MSIEGVESTFLVKRVSLRKTYHSLALCNETIESYAVRISFNKCYISILAMYRPYSDTINIDNLSELLQNPLLSNDYKVIFARDVNINLDILDLIHVNNYTLCLSISFFIHTITKCICFPPYDSNISPSNVDHIL